MNSAVIEKIRKLLRLAKSPNPHEAAAAIAMAFEIARKHQVDMESIDLNDDEEIERFLMSVGASLSFERKLILNLVKRFFRVEVIVCRPNVAFIGRQTDVMIARYAHDFLLTSCRSGIAAFKAEIRRKLSPTRRKNYIQGWVYGVADKLETTGKKMALENSRYAIVQVKDDPRVMQAASEWYPETKDLSIVRARRDKNAMIAGWIDGKKVDVNQPLTGPERLALN